MCVHVDGRKRLKNNTNYRKPLKNSVALTLAEFDTLTKVLPEVNEDIPELEAIKHIMNKLYVITANHLYQLRANFLIFGQSMRLMTLAKCLQSAPVL